YTGTVSGFSGTDHIDLAGVAFATATKSFAKGVLTVDDHHGHVAKIRFNGSYTLANFNLSDDNNGGMLITDPPAKSGGLPPAHAPVGPPSPVTIGHHGAASIALFANHMASAFPAAAGPSAGLTLATEPASLPVLANPHGALPAH